MPHAESEHGLRVQLATALRERDEARERWTHFLNQAFAADAALAAARLEIEELRGAIALHLKCPEEAAASCLAEIRDDFSVVDSALAAPASAAGEEGT